MILDMTDATWLALLAVGLAVTVSLGVACLVRMSALSRYVEELKGFTQSEQGRLERALREEFALSRREWADGGSQARRELTEAMSQFSQSIRHQLADFREQLTRLIDSNETKSEALRVAVEQKLSALQGDNAQRLEEMRRTVAEKLEGTLERRLGDSFKIVSERLEQVHKGLGEMQSLAVGVGDLKKVMTNVKTRGTWGEIQLGSLLEQMLSPEQFDRNVQTKKSANGRVEYAVRMPGREFGDVVWLPIDAKFPNESYERLIDAQERSASDDYELAVRQLEGAIKLCAKDICDKYISPPDTTDFAVMYLPTEGLFAEVVRRVGLVEQIQRECRVVVAGPTTLAALLNSLQMGFRTLAIQKRSSEVWEILGAVKTEFSSFGEVLKKVEKKLQEAGNVINKASTRTRVIEKKLKGVQELPRADAMRLMGASQFDGPDLEMGEAERTSSL